jgi:hypothetical protein
MSTSEGPSTGKSGDSRSHQWRFVVNENVAYHLTHNAGKSWKIQEKVRAPGFEPWWVPSHGTVLPLDYKHLNLTRTTTYATSSFREFTLTRAMEPGAASVAQNSPEKYDTWGQLGMVLSIQNSDGETELCKRDSSWCYATAVESRRRLHLGYVLLRSVACPLVLLRSFSFQLYVRAVITMEMKELAISIWYFCHFVGSIIEYVMDLKFLLLL